MKHTKDLTMISSDLRYAEYAMIVGSRIVYTRCRKMIVSRMVGIVYLTIVGSGMMYARD